MQLLLDNQAVVFSFAVFGIVFLMTLVVSGMLHRSNRMHARLEKARAMGGAAGPRMSRGMHVPLPRGFDEKLFGLDESARSELRRDLIRAGFFHRQAVPMYLASRLLFFAGLPLVGWLYMSAVGAGVSTPVRLVLMSVLVFLGYYGPKAFISFRQRKLQQRYRDSFPEMMDVLVVCVDAGLSLEAAIERVSREIGASNRHLGINLALMVMEMRSGRGTIQSIQTLADRLGIDEASSLAILLRQSSELGTSISESLRVYSDEMRDKRMSRAEEKAHALPAKLVLPLAAFIFPVILIVVMLPLIVRIMGVIGSV